jgi:hypothetical protein
MEDKTDKMSLPAIRNMFMGCAKNKSWLKMFSWFPKNKFLAENVSEKTFLALPQK